MELSEKIERKRKLEAEINDELFLEILSIEFKDFNPAKERKGEEPEWVAVRRELEELMEGLVKYVPESEYEKLIRLRELNADARRIYARHAAIMMYGEPCDYPFTDVFD